MSYSAMFGRCLLVVVVGACSTSTSDPMPGGGGEDGADAGGGGGGGAIDAGSGVGLPLTVDDWFAAGGYMGDGEQPGAVVDDEECAATRPGGGRGLCHRFTWDPATAGWAGVYWQHPEGNWGAMPGLPAPTGATRVTFYAWGAQGGEVVSFMVGMADPDGFEVKQDVVLTATPAQYTLDLSDAVYDRVIGGFGWVSEGSAVPVEFYVDDIVWE